MTLNIDRPIVDMDDLEGEELSKAMKDQRDIEIWNMDENKIREGIFNLMKDAGSKDDSQPAAKLEPSDFILAKYSMNYGAKSKNPLMRMRFYEKMSAEKLIGPAEELPIAEPPDESRHYSVIPHSFQKVGIRVLVRDNKKRSTVNQVFLQWFETGDTLPNQCAAEPTTLFHQFQAMDDNQYESDVDIEDEQRRGRDYPAQLSQDFEDSDSGDENDDRNNPMFQQDTSPIPVRTRAR